MSGLRNNQEGKINALAEQVNCVNEDISPCTTSDDYWKQAVSKWASSHMQQHQQIERGLGVIYQETSDHHKPLGEQLDPQNSYAS
jgi:hypothetical protein